MSLSLIDPRNRVGRRQEPPEPIPPPPEQVTPVVLPPAKLMENEPGVMLQRLEESAQDYAMLRYFCTLAPGQRKSKIIAEHFNIPIARVNAVKDAYDWIERSSALDTWMMLREQHALSKKQDQHRELESMGAQVLFNEFMRRFKHVPDTQILAMFKEFAKANRLALGMPTVQAEIHHKHTLDLVVRKTLEIAVRYIPADSLDAFRRDLGDELPTLEGEIVTRA